jgi:uncharacterized protein YneF (UPF0154 family)
MLGLQYTIEIIPVGTLSAVILTIGIIIYFWIRIRKMKNYLHS